MTITIVISLIFYLILWLLVKSTIVYEMKNRNSYWPRAESNLDKSSAKPLKIKLWIYLICLLTLPLPIINSIVAFAMFVTFWCAFGNIDKDKVWKMGGKLYNWLNKEL